VPEDRNRILFHAYDGGETVHAKCVHAFPLHIHRCWCVGQMTGGAACLVLGGESRLMSAGDWYVVPAYAPHSLASVGSEPIAYTVTCGPTQPLPDRFSPVIADAVAYIQSAEPGFRLDDLADAVHVSKYHLCRRFAYEVGVSPYQFFAACRVGQARRGVEERVPLANLSATLGFCDQAHLGNSFKRHVGVSPHEYAESYRYG